MFGSARKFLSAVLVALASGTAAAAPVTFVDTGASYKYSVIGDLWPNWASVNLATFDNFAASSPIAGWSTGNSAFGNSSGLPQATNWTANTDLALYTTFNVAGSATGALTLRVASDNGFLVFLNDQLLAKENAEGYTGYWEYTFSSSSALLSAGTNVLKILAEDHGGATFFDMQLTGNLNVPEPASIALVGLALIGMGATRRRKA